MDTDCGSRRSGSDSLHSIFYRTRRRRAELEIEKHTVEMETAAKMLAMLARNDVDNPEAVFAATRSVVNAIGNTGSVAVAYVPDYFPQKGRYFEVCSSRISADSIYTRQIGSANHDYTQMEWWQNGFKYDGCRWSEPYMDDSGSKAYVVSCSYPVKDKNDVVVAVVCVDLSLDYLQHISDYLQIYQGSYYSIQSSEGVDITDRPDTVPGRKYAIFNEEIDATGWKMSVIIPDDVIYAGLKRVGLIVTIMMLLGLALLIFIIIRTGKNFLALINLSNKQERIESELTIACKIQMAMLPTRFPPFPDYSDISAYGAVIPAKEVGGDLFDFYIRDNRLFFCIGDVSGKGVPASIVMAMTRSLFRSFTSYIDSPAQIVTQINNSLSGEDNDQSMFVTFFLGVLDLSDGSLRYCNAGHNAPVKVKNESKEVKGETIDCKPNLPLGVLAGFGYEEQNALLAAGDTLFLYTDGLNEAENVSHEQFGEERMNKAIERCSKINGEGVKEPKEMIEDITADVQAFAGNAEQSDDLTMFAIRLKAYGGRTKMTGDKHFSLVMRNDIKQIPTLSEWIETIGLPVELNMPINLALEEAVSNVMLYAYPAKSGEVLVECDVKEEKERTYIFTITDSGVPFDPTQQEDPDVTLNAEERPIGGLGIFLVRQIMDDIRYERKDGKNILTLSKKLNG